MRDYKEERSKALQRKLEKGMRGQAVRRLAKETPRLQAETNEAALQHMQTVAVLVAERRRQKLTQKALAERMGVAVVTVARIEGGIVSPTLRILLRMATALDLRLKLG